MKAKRIHYMMGVTLLEIMLVLAIAGVIVLMSVRYYQGASSQSKETQTISLINGILVAGEKINGTQGTYKNVSEDTLATAMGLPGNTVFTPYGNNITVKAQDTGFTITITTPNQVTCTSISEKLSKIYSPSPDCKSGALSVKVGTGGG